MTSGGFGRRRNGSAGQRRQRADVGQQQLGEKLAAGEDRLQECMRGFATLRGSLEMTGDAYVLVVSNGGTRQQVSFLFEGKLAKSMRKSIGHQVQISGVLDKTSRVGRTGGGGGGGAPAP